MSELEVLAALRPDMPLADPGELAPARSRLIAGIAEAATVAAPEGSPNQRGVAVPDAAPAPPSGRGRWRSGRLRLAGALGVAAAAVAALLVVPGHGGPSAGTGNNGKGASSTPFTVKPGSSPGSSTGKLTLTGFLTAAASAALHQTATPPRPDQFVYGETVFGGTVYRGTTPNQPGTIPGRPGTSKYQIWQSADGEKPGLIIQPTHYPVPPCPATQAEHSGCPVSNGYLPDLPTQPAAAMAYLIKIGVFSRDDTGSIPQSPANWVANDVGKQMTSMLTSMYFLPAQRAALYELMAGIKGFRIVPHVSLFGHQGVGVAWTYENGETTMVFSPRSYAYLGSIGINKSGGKYYIGTAWLAELAVVNKAGQLP